MASIDMLPGAERRAVTGGDPLDRARPRGHRILALDMTKGVLVVCMVVYHSLNYSTNYALGFKFIPFLPPSFILITGFLLGRSYSERAHPVRVQAFTRIFLRGARLLVLFTLLNVAAQMTGGQRLNGGSLGIEAFFGHWFEVYVTGEGRYAAFEVLLAIAYLLMAAPLLLLLDRINRFMTPALALVLIGYSSFLERQGELSANLHLFAAGVLGIVLGRVSLKTLDTLARYWWVWIAVYAGYLMVAHIAGQSTTMQVLGACLALMLIFAACVRLGETGLISHLMMKLGMYSLLAYILQIGLLQVLSRLWGRLEPFSPLFYLQMLAVLVVMILTAEVMNWTRRKSRTVDVSYKAVFA